MKIIMTILIMFMLFIIYSQVRKFLGLSGTQFALCILLSLAIYDRLSEKK